MKHKAIYQVPNYELRLIHGHCQLYCSKTQQYLCSLNAQDLTNITSVFFSEFPNSKGKFLEDVKQNTKHIGR